MISICTQSNANENSRIDRPITEKGDLTLGATEASIAWRSWMCLFLINVPGIVLDGICQVLAITVTEWFTQNGKA